MAMASTGAAAVLSSSSRGAVSLVVRNSVYAGKNRVIGASLDVIFHKNCDLGRGLGAALHLANNSDGGDRVLVKNPRGVKGLSSNRLRSLIPKATVKEGVEQDADAAAAEKSVIKDFLDELKAVGRVRLIVNTGVAVLESVTTFEKLFYHDMPGRGEYANLMLREDNVDFHLLLSKVKLAQLVRGKSMRGNIPTYMVKFVDISDSAAVSVLVMWKPETDGEYDPGQVEAFEALEAKYGSEVKFVE